MPGFEHINQYLAKTAFPACHISSKRAMGIDGFVMH